MKRISAVLLLMILPVLAVSQSPGSLSGPTLGFIFDNSLGIVRPLLGISGNATVGAPVDVGSPVTNVISLTDQHSILAVPESGPYLLSIDLEASPPFSRSITGALKSAEITLSPNGKTAALAHQVGQLVEVVTGLPDHPAVILEVTTVLINAPLQRVVVNDAGTLLLITFLENDRETIYRWNRTEGYRLLASTVRVGALGFVGPSDAVYADGGTNEVYFAHDVKTGSVTQFLAGPSDGISGPIGIGASNTGGFFIANSASRMVVMFDANHRIVRSQQCDCNITGVYPLSAGIFRLTERLNQTIYLVDESKSEARLVFVPPLQ